MSNSRKIKRSVKRNVSAISMAALGTVTVGGVLMTTAGTAFAATSPQAPTLATESLAPGASATTVYPGLSNQPAGSLRLEVSNTFAAGDKISLPIEPNGAANTDPTTAVTYSVAPTVTPSAGSVQTNPADSTPALTATLTTNPADGNAAANAGVKDDLVLTFGNSFTGTATDSYYITISGIQYNVGAKAGQQAGPEPVEVAANYTYTPTGGNATTVAFTGSPVTNANISNNVVTETPTGVPSGALGAALSNFVITETVPAVLSAQNTPSTGVYTLAPSTGGFTGTATITATGFTVAALPSNGVCPAPGATGVGTTATATANAAGQYQFCVVSATNATTGPGSLTISGMSYNAPAGTGPVTVTLTGPAGGQGPYSTAQPAITLVAQTRVAGVSADDTAAQAAESVVGQTFHNQNGGPVILASDSEYQDALSASALGYAPLQYQTFGGTFPTFNGPTPLLLNPYDAPNGTEAQTAAVNAIRQMGATTVYIIGGTAAISQDVQDQLSKIQVGTTITGAPVNLQVIRIAGQTAEQTAAMVASYPGGSNNAPANPPGQVAPGFPATPGAYGMYNSGASESASSPFTTGTSVPTAILADADEFQDALAASGLAYHYNLPVLLNAGGQGLDSNASTTLSNLGIKQVIIVGGSSAVADSVVAGLQNIGISVLRIAGTTFDATAQLLAQFETNFYTPPPTPPAVTPAQVQDGLDSTANYNGNSLTVGTSRGDAYQDALSSAQVLGQRNHDVVPLLLNSGVSTLSTGTGNFLGANGTSPNGGLTVYTNNAGAKTTRNVVGDVVFGGTLAQTPALVQAELNVIASGTAPKAS